MTHDNPFEAAAQAAEPLYRWWFDAVPGLFAGRTGHAATASAGNGTAAPFPIGQMTQALALTRQLLKPLQDTLLQAVSLNHAGQAFDLLEQALQGSMGELTDQFSAITQAQSGQPGSGLAAALGAGWTNTPLTAFAEAMKPLQLNLERTYGGLADAFGLAASRELQQAMRDMAAATLAHRQAQTEYLGLFAGAVAKGNDALLSQLAAMAQRGESIDSVKALIRLWARVTDEAMHEAMQSPGALEAAARLVRTATRSRRQQQRVVEIASQALNVPTRSEVDEAYREIQELKRELRRLRKALPIAPDDLSSDGAKPGAGPGAARASRKSTAAKAPAKRQPGRKAAKS